MISSRSLNRNNLKTLKGDQATSANGLAVLLHTCQYQRLLQTQCQRCWNSKPTLPTKPARRLSMFFLLPCLSPGQVTCCTVWLILQVVKTSFSFSFQWGFIVWGRNRSDKGSKFIGFFFVCVCVVTQKHSSACVTTTFSPWCNINATYKILHIFVLRDLTWGLSSSSYSLHIIDWLWQSFSAIVPINPEDWGLLTPTQH